ncbi:MAG: hypothetical protein Q4B73_01565 [Lachnospiraceae bacterium]|nr:hypothetical protein [Lachnospiraceae bacterium]
MCTSITVNKNKTLVGWNLDILGMVHRVRSDENGVYIDIKDDKEGWIPIFGANKRGDFVGMPTCHPFDDRSNPVSPACPITMMLGIDLLLQKKTFQEIKSIAEKEPVYSIPGVTFMSSLTDAEGNVLHIIPGQGYKYYEKPDHIVLTNFSPFKGESEMHPWMGLDRFQTAEKMLAAMPDDGDVDDIFKILKACSQEVCPTVVSMVFDTTERTVYWCENREYDNIQKKVL